MRVAEHMISEGNGFARGFDQPPLQIRMNPFVPGKSRGPIFDARIYLGEKAIGIGRPNLFTAEALDVVIHGTRNALGELRAVAELAFFAAATGGASQIGSMHVLRALEARLGKTEEPAQASEEFSIPEKHIETTAPMPAVYPPDAPFESPIVSEIVPLVEVAPASNEAFEETDADVTDDEPLESTHIGDDEPAEPAQTQAAPMWLQQGRQWMAKGGTFAHAVSITAFLLVAFALAGFVSSHWGGKARVAVSVSTPVSKPAAFANAIVPPPAAPALQTSSPSLTPITAENTSTAGGKDSVSAAPATKVAAAKRKRPRVRRRAKIAAPVEDVAPETAAAAEASTVVPSPDADDPDLQ